MLQLGTKKWFIIIIKYACFINFWVTALTDIQAYLLDLTLVHIVKTNF